mmetsp:Transcript_9381/g.27043  ORF Transcript_9381/g.27043 Transcript_9381/m.27043 type:complete len:200 (-) Transcript_9381:777-1376(-)
MATKASPRQARNLQRRSPSAKCGRRRSTLQRRTGYPGRRWPSPRPSLPPRLAGGRGSTHSAIHAAWQRRRARTCGGRCPASCALPTVRNPHGGERPIEANRCRALARTPGRRDTPRAPSWRWTSAPFLLGNNRWGAGNEPEGRDALRTRRPMCCLCHRPRRRGTSSSCERYHPCLCNRPPPPHKGQPHAPQLPTPCQAR